ncbi:MAG: ABC transporter permease [Candidatus Saccharimonadia bacterium]
MKRTWQSLWSLTVASVKMYFRNVTAVFFTLFIPVILIGIFGLLNTGNTNGSIHIGLTNYSSSSLGTSYVSAIDKVSAFKIDTMSESSATDMLGKGKIDLQVIVPQSFGTVDKFGRLVPTSIIAHYNSGNPGTGQTAGLILGQIASGLNSGLTKSPQIISVSTTGVKTNNLNYIDFLVPGIMAMSIMQLGIFSVAFGFISFKTSGALRRLQATPTHPINFILGQSVARLIIGILQVFLLLFLGIAFFHMHLVGSIVELLIVATLGVIVFLAFGFGIAGWAKEENQAAPVANLISFPMLFLSGVFFPRDNFPGYLKTITNFFPLTYLADAMHQIANQGAGLWTVRTDILGLVVWGILAYAVAVKLFRWE